MLQLVRILLWNANGVQKHKEERELLMSTEKIDVSLISETHFTKESYFKIPLYEIYTIHPLNCARGGSAIIVRSSLKHHEEIQISTTEFETTTIAIEMNGSEICLCALYNPPRCDVIKCHDYSLLAEILTLNTPTGVSLTYSKRQRTF